MKRSKKSINVLFLGMFIALVVIAIAGMNMRTLINNTEVTKIARKAGANDASRGDVLENYTFTSDTAGIGVMGSITDYSQTLNQYKIDASAANQTAIIDVDDGYYTQIKLNITDVYNAGYDAGVEDSKVETLELSISGTDVNATDPPNPDSSVFQHTEGSINTGYVIRDKNNGNEFVWVPVKKDQKISLNVEMKENITNLTLTDPFGANISLGTVSGKTYTNTNITPTINGMYTATVTTASGTKTKTLVVRSLYAVDALNDYPDAEGGNYPDNPDHHGKVTSEWSDTVDYTSSVNTNGGFYIGRYEAGAPTYRSSPNTAQTSAQIISANGKPVCKANQKVYNFINQSQAKGLAESMYTSSNYTCTLPTGAAWDRTIDWLIETGDKTLTKATYQSIVWGNYNSVDFEVEPTAYGSTDLGRNYTTISNSKKPASNMLLTTGAAPTRNVSNNIFDLAGNIREWTTEVIGAAFVDRGGNFDDSGLIKSADFRDSYNNSSDRLYSIGFRPALFL